MPFLQPDSLADALELKAAEPDAVPIAGGTDLMVDLNFGRARPSKLLDLGRVAELRDWSTDGETVRLGAGVTYARVIEELGTECAGLAMASRTVGSPQIRSRGTIGGNLATASPAGDALPLLYACDAEVEVASSAGVRRVPIEAFVPGPRRTALGPDELVTAVHVPRARGPQQFSKVGTRNAMVIAICSVGLALFTRSRRVAVCLGSAGPTPLRAPAAEAFAAGVLEESGRWESPEPLGDAELDRFGDLVAAAAAPIDDVRASAAYRRHALAVIARRALAWAWSDYSRELECA